MDFSWLAYRWAGTTLVVGAMLWSCSSGKDSSGGGDPLGDGPNIGVPQATGGSTAQPVLELELEENFRSPVVSGPYLWSANPETNRVARINAESFEVEVVDGGHGPTFLAALPQTDGPDGAVVINVFGDNVSVFREGEEGMGGGTGALLSETRFPVQPGASAWAVGASGKIAIAWSKFEQDLRGPLDGYQDLTVLELDADPPTATRLSVGFRPTQVVINQDETRAFVVSRPGLSVLDLGGETPTVLHELFLPDQGDEATRDVSFTPDGDFAFVRLNRSSDVLVIRTEDDTRVTVSLPREVTDLDLSGDGTTAIAVMRGNLLSTSVGMGGFGGQGGTASSGDDDGLSNTPSQIAVMNVPEIFDAPTTFDLVETDELVGSVVIAHDASRAVFFTSAVDNPHLLTLDLDDLSQRVSDLQAPAQAAFLSEDGKYAAAVMTPPTGSTSSGAFALMIAGEDLPLRLEGTSTVPRFISLTQDRCLVTTWGSETAPAVVYLGKFPDLSVDRVELPGEPLASGMVPDAQQGFVAQAHPEGRVTFIDWDTALPTTVTGFELSSKVVQK